MNKPIDKETRYYITKGQYNKLTMQETPGTGRP